MAQMPSDALLAARLGASVVTVAYILPSIGLGLASKRYGLSGLRLHVESDTFKSSAEVS